MLEIARYARARSRVQVVLAAISVLALSILLPLVFYFASTERYKSESLALIESMVSQPQLPAGLGSIAAITGIQLGGAGEERVLAELNSYASISEFLNNELLDRKTKDKSDPVSRELEYLLAGAEGITRAVIERFRQDYLRVQSLPGSRIVKISIECIEPSVCVRWLVGIVELADHNLKKEAAEKAEENIEFLTSMIEGAPQRVVREAASKLLEQELSARMIASAHRPYALRVIDPPMLADAPSSPRLGLVLFFGFSAVWIVAAVLGLGSIRILEGVERYKDSN
jgi:hypothetical protein